MNKSALFGCGAALGVLIGLLVGLSTTPVVATVVSALVGIMTVYCTASAGGGLQEAIKATDTKPPPSVHAHVFLAGFSLCAAIAVIGGVYIRTHDLLSPTPAQVEAEWLAAKFTLEEAKQIMRAGQVVKDGDTSAVPVREHSVLVARDLSKCDELTGDLRAGLENWDAAESAFKRSGGDWETLLERSYASIEDKHVAMRNMFQQTCLEHAK